MHRLTVDDLLRLEDFGEVALAPDGRWLAFVRQRPRLSAAFHKYDFLFGGDRGDVWLVETSGGAPQNMTRGGDEGAGYWAPSWSPDSERLAMLGTKGGNVHLWCCDIRSGRLTQLSGRAVDLDSRAAPYLWVSERSVLVATLPEGKRPGRMVIEVQAAESAMHEWRKAWAGVESTASVLDSGSCPPFEERPQGELLLVDVVSGRERAVMRGFVRELRIAPDRRHVAFFRQIDVIRPSAGRRLVQDGPEMVRLAIVTAEGEVVAEGVEELDSSVTTSLRWSPDSTELALMASASSSPDSVRQAFRYRLADGRVQPVTEAGLEATSLLWAAEGGMLLLAIPVRNRPDEGRVRADWWLVRGDRDPRKLTGDVSGVPTQLFPEPGRGSFVGLTGGDIFRFSVGDCGWEKLTASFEAPVSWLVWPAAGVSDGETFAQLVFAVDQATSTAWHRLDLRSGELSSLPWPSDRGWLLDFAPELDVAVPVAVDRMGARLWVSKPAFEQHTAVAETNIWLRDFGEGEPRRIDYHGRDGEDLKGWLILPIGYEPGERYPLITWVYPGLVFATETPPIRLLSIAGHHALNVQLLPARGYAVLLPSMPLKHWDEPSDPYTLLTNGVLPAVDEAIELGIADAERLGVMGQSYGGYGTYGLITQTQRFQAAVALAGFAELVSLYGQFDPRVRYGDHPHERMFQMSLAESGQTRMGGAPWEDPQRYVRNSPLFHVEQVETPLLIVQGDMDYVPLGQGEQFFSALYRQGKRARFVRYWGEGHVLQSPANIRHMWEEIYAWFDDHLKPSTSVPHEAQ